MSFVAAAIVGGTMALGAGGNAYMQSKAADAARDDAATAQKANDKKDALFNLMTVVGGQGANPMGNTQPLPPKGNGWLGIGLGALQGGMQGAQMGMGMKADASAASDKKAYMESQIKLNDAQIARLGAVESPSAYTDAQTSYMNNLNQASFSRGADGAITGFNPKPQALSPMELMWMMGGGWGGVGGTSPDPILGGRGSGR